MKFSTTSGELQRILTKVNGVIPSRSTMPILEHVLFDLLNDTLTVTATDMEIALTASVAVQGVEDGRIAIPAKKLLDTLRALPDVPVTFVIDVLANKIKLTTSNGEYALTGENAKDYPEMPECKGTDELTFENQVLARIIVRTLFAVSVDELRPAMMGVLFQPKEKSINVVATDGHRLVKMLNDIAQPFPVEKDVIIPAKALHIVSKMLDAGSTSITMDEKHVKFVFEKSVLISRLIEEKYPNYESVIPLENDKKLTVKRDNLISSIRRVALYASATTHQIRFQVSNNELSVSAQDMDMGGEAREKLSCEYQNENIEIGFNSSYVIDILTHLDSDEVTFNLSTPTRAALVTPAPADKVKENVVMLVMPVRLNN